MHSHFKTLIDTRSAKTNPDVVKGFVGNQLKGAANYIDGIIRSVSKGFPKGLTYVGMSRVGPREEYTELVRSRNSKHTYELSPSNIYMVKYMFEFKGDSFGRYLHLPYVSHGTLIPLGGTLYHMAPVLTDRVITPNANGVFVRLLRDKLNFTTLPTMIKVDDIPVTLQVVYSEIYRKGTNGTNAGDRVPRTTKAVTCLTHYLLGKYGYSEMFSKYMGFIPDIMESKDYHPDKYPVQTWVKCESTGIKPKSRLNTPYEPTNLVVMVPRDNWDTHTKNLIGGLFYVIDHFPEHIDLEMLDKVNTWRIIMGYIIQRESFSIHKLISTVQEHFSKLDDYVDDIIQTNLLELGYNIDNFYDLMSLIMSEYSRWSLHRDKYSGGVKDRYLDIMYYVMYEISSGLFRIAFNLKKVALKKDITIVDVTNGFNKWFTKGKIFKLVKSNKVNVSMTVVGASGDNLYPKILSLVVLQESGDGVVKSKNGSLPDSCKRLSGDDLGLGSLLNLTKTTPSPKIKLNLYANINLTTGDITPGPELDQDYEQLEYLLNK